MSATLLDELPRWREHRARVEDARKRHADVATQVLAARRAFEEAVATREKAVRDAVASGKPVPVDEPVMPSAFDVAVAQCRAESDALAHEARLLRAELAPAVEELAAKRWEQRRQTIAEACLLVEQAAQRTSAEAAEVANVRGVADAVAGLTVRPSRATRTRTVFDVAAIAELVQQHGDPFELEPLPATTVQVDVERNPTARGGSIAVQRDPRSPLLDPQRRL